MPTLNSDCPRIYACVREEYLHDLRSHHGHLVPACVFGVASVPGTALGFHALLENGAAIWRLPLSALVHRAGAPHWPIDVHQQWDCLSAEVVVHEFGRLRRLPVVVTLKDKTQEKGRYLFTVDWHGAADADDAGKGGGAPAHVIKLDNGLFVAQPNHRIRWLDSCFVRPELARPGYRTQSRVFVCETGRRWHD